MTQIYEKDLLVQYGHCDVFDRMKLSYILKEAQQLRMEHCDLLGIGSYYLKSLNMVFLLAKLKVTIHALPKGGQKLHLVTCPTLPARAQYMRFTHMRLLDGTPMVDVDSRWVLVDTNTHKIFRKVPEQLELPFPPPDRIDDFRMPRLNDYAPAGDFRVQYSNLDSNQHMNNAEYADVVANLLSDQLMQGKPVRELEFYYHNEATLGEKISLFTCQQDDTFFVRGMLDNTMCFESIVRF